MPHPVDFHVGHRVKELRNIRGLTQSDVAASLGFSFQQLQKYETGSNRISASRLYELAQHLGVATPYFFEGLEGEAQKDPTRVETSLEWELIGVVRKNGGDLIIRSILETIKCIKGAA